MPVQHTSDVTATEPEVIDQIATELSKSAVKLSVFEEVYRGGNRPKTAEQIGTKLGLSAQRVLAVATPMADKHYFEKTRVSGLTGYKKYRHINAAKQKILRLARNPKALASHVTIRKPRVQAGAQVIKIEIDAGNSDIEITVKQITIDHIENFKKVRNCPATSIGTMSPSRLPEKVFKYGVAEICGAKGTFTDWGGEKNDLYLTNIIIAKESLPAAIAFKGPATAPPLVPRKMGKNGDQISRLFDSTAQVFLVQFEGQIDESILRMMRAHAVEKAMAIKQPVYYGIVALEDSYRLRAEYMKQFEDAALEHGVDLTILEE